LKDSNGLHFYQSRYYDSGLARFIQPDLIVPDPYSPQTLNRFAYALNNPAKYTDPTGHWSEDELREELGEDWETAYFGEEAVFEGRDKLREFLTSDKTTGREILAEVSKMLKASELAHKAGVDFRGIDAIGSRIVGAGGSGWFGGASGDAVLNLSAGQLSWFGSLEGGFQLGASGNLSAGLFVIKNLPSNDAYKGTCMSVGVQGGAGVGLTAEAFWTSPMDDSYNPANKALGAFAGGGPAIKGIGMYGSLSYAFEVARLNATGLDVLPYSAPPSVLGDIAGALWHDIVLHPAVNPFAPTRQ
jgi:RHS repeat-associated protein